MCVRVCVCVCLQGGAVRDWVPEERQPELFVPAGSGRPHHKMSWKLFLSEASVTRFPPANASFHSHTSVAEIGLGLGLEPVQQPL